MRGMLIFLILSISLIQCKAQDYIDWVQPQGCLAPSVLTAAVSDLGYDDVTLNGELTSDGGCATVAGFCWNTTGNPTILNDTIQVASSTGSFSEHVVLNCGTTYYVRAFAENETGVSYGSEVSFSTGTVNFPTMGFTYAIASSDCPNGAYAFSGDSLLALQACADIKSGCVNSWNGISMKVESLTVGTQTYGYNSCYLSGRTGFYLVDPQYSTKLVHIVNSVIVSITETNCE